LGVYAYTGPNWARDKQVLCDAFKHLCFLYNSLDENQPTSIESEKYWVANQCVDRFQENNPNFADGDYETSYLDLSKIDRVPIGLFIGTDDETCTYAHAFEYIPQFGVDLSINILQGATHHYHSSPVPDSYV